MKSPRFSLFHGLSMPYWGLIDNLFPLNCLRALSNPCVSGGYVRGSRLTSHYFWGSLFEIHPDAWSALPPVPIGNASTKSDFCISIFAYWRHHHSHRRVQHVVDQYAHSSSLGARDNMRKTGIVNDDIWLLNDAHLVEITVSNPSLI